MDYTQNKLQPYIEQPDMTGLAHMILDTMPLSCICWDENCNSLTCNNKALELFEFTDKRTYLERFHDLSPQYQPNGRPSKELAQEYIKKAFNGETLQFEWLHQTVDGVSMPCEVTLVKTPIGKGEFVISYTKDLREITALTDQMRKADERAQIMLDATPLCANFWDENYNNIDCNEEAAKLFELKSKQEYLDRFNELSPEYQPCGTLSQVLALEKIKTAFKDGFCKFEWLHQKPNGELIPSEITLVRVEHKGAYVVAGYTRDLRELKATMDKMREADERTQIMLDATPLCANFWDTNHNNIDCNQEAVKLFGLKNKKEYLDRFYELSPEYQPCGRLTSEMSRGKIDTAFKTGYCNFEWMHQKLNGEPIPSEITLVRVKHKNGYIVVGYTRDLRELKATLGKMREADERTRIMLDATPLCCNLWNKNYENIDCNQEAVNLFELKDKNEYLKRFFELSPELQPNGRLSSEIAKEKINEAFKNGYCRFEWMHQKLNGEPVPSEITLVRVQYKNDYIVAGYTRDLRELKAMLSEMHAVQNELRVARDAAEESARIKSEFLANMSHEIRTPMNGILGMLHLLLNTETTDKQRNYLQKTNQSAKALLRIINDILDFSKIEAGKLDMEYSPFVLEDILKDLNDTFEAQLNSKNLSFNIEKVPNIPQTLVGDGLRLKQVMFNLMDNAVKFTPKGGKINGYVQILNQNSKYCYLQFTLTDTGIGMTQEQLDGLFSPFNQADSSFTRIYGGTGLGLAISRNLVNAMHGEIWASSEYGQGSSFSFTVRLEMPQARVEDDSTQAHAIDDSIKASVSHAKASILLAEDNEINQMIAKELLENMGHNVDIACNGEEAINMLQAKPYDLVLMDIQMPVMDGLTATRAIRSNNAYRNLPIIAMSAHAMAHDHEKSLASGMNDHLSKPIIPEILDLSLKKWLP